MPPKKTSSSKSTSTSSSTSTTKKAPLRKVGSSAPVKASTAKKTAPAKAGVKKAATPAKPTPAKTGTEEIEKKLEEVVICVTEVPFKKIATVLLEDADGKIKTDGRCPLVIDPTGNAATFLKYREVNFIDATNPTQLQPEVLRKALLGAIRYGKVMGIDMQDADMFDTCAAKFEEVYKGLMDDVMSKEIIKKYKLIVKKSDGDEYKKAYDFCDDLMNNFKFIIMTKIEPNAELMKKTYPIRVIP